MRSIPPELRTELITLAVLCAFVLVLGVIVASRSSHTAYPLGSPQSNGHTHAPSGIVQEAKDILADEAT